MTHRNGGRSTSGFSMAYQSHRRSMVMFSGFIFSYMVYTKRGVGKSRFSAQDFSHQILTVFIGFMLSAIKVSLIDAINASDDVSGGVTNKAAMRWKQIEKYLATHLYIMNADVRVLCSVSAATANQTYNAGWRNNRLAAFSRKHPDLCQRKRPMRRAACPMSWTSPDCPWPDRIMQRFGLICGQNVGSVPGVLTAITRTHIRYTEKIPMFSRWWVFPNGGFSAIIKLWIFIPHPGTYVLRHKPRKETVSR